MAWAALRQISSTHWKRPHEILIIPGASSSIEMKLLLRWPRKANFLSPRAGTFMRSVKSPMFDDPEECVDRSLVCDEGQICRKDTILGIIYTARYMAPCYSLW